MNLGFSKFVAYLYGSRERLRAASRALVADRPAAILLASAAFLNIGGWLAAYFLERAIGDDVAVLHYNVVFGIDLVGAAERFYVTPLTGLIALALNFFLASFASLARERMLAVMILGIATAVNFFVLLALYFSYLVNFS